MKKNENDKKMDNNKKINYNIIMEKPRKIKKIYLPKKIDNLLRSNSNKKLKNEIISQYLSHRSNTNNNNNYTNKNIDFFNNKINEDDINRDRDYIKSNYNFKGLNKITNNINHKIPLYCKDQKLKINSYNSSSSNYPTHQTETSSLNFKQKYPPTSIDNNILKLYSHIKRNKRNNKNRIGSCNYSFTTYHPNNNNLNYEYNSGYDSFLYKGTNIRTHRIERPKADSFDNISCKNYTYRSRIHERQLYNPVCFNNENNDNNDNKVPQLFLDTNRRFHYSNSYRYKNDININRSFPLNKYEHSFLSHRKYQNNLNPLQRKKYFYNKYNSDINKYRRNINNMRVKNSPYLLLNGNNIDRKIIKIPKNCNLFKSRSNENFHMKNNNNLKFNLVNE